MQCATNTLFFSFTHFLFFLSLIVWILKNLVYFINVDYGWPLTFCKTTISLPRDSESKWDSRCGSLGLLRTQHRLVWFGQKFPEAVVMLYESDKNRDELTNINSLFSSSSSVIDKGVPVEQARQHAITATAHHYTSTASIARGSSACTTTSTRVVFCQL